MTTPAKVAANRRNSLCSTGPRTPAGKLVVARNAIRHGIFARLPVVPGECEGDWQTHRQGVLDSLTPVGLLEVTLAERAALLLWRLARLARYEAENTAAAVEDAGLLPPDLDPIPHALARPRAQENQLSLAEQELRSERGALASARAETEFLRRTLTDATADPLPAREVRMVLGEAYTLALDGAAARQVPAWHIDRAFLDRVGFAPDRPANVPWPRSSLLFALDLYAAAAGRTACEFRDELVRVIEGRVERFVRGVSRWEQEVDALRRRLDAERQRCESAALLPPAEAVERIMKYERHLHGQLTSTLHELERLQARRGGAVVPAPAAADLHITINQG